jgi:DNA polymerase III sliding clamp (beta) subunit (PCNA family)
MKQLAKIRRILKNKSGVPLYDQLICKDGYIYLGIPSISVKIKNPVFEHKGVFMTNSNIFIKHLQNISMPIDFIKSAGKIQIKSGKSSISLGVDLPEDLFHDFDNEDKVVRTIYVSESDRRKIVAGLNFVAEDQLRPVMECVYYGEGRIAATDARKLYFPECDNKAGHVLLPKQVVKLVADQHDIKIEEIEHKRERKQYKVTSPGLVIKFTIDSLNYPAFMNVIPNKPLYEFQTSKSPLLAYLKTVKGLSYSDLTKFKFTSDNVDIANQSIDFGIEKGNSLPGKLTILKKKIEKEIEIGFKTGILIQALEAIGSELITIRMEDPTRAAVINDYLLLMPMMISYPEEINKS